MEILLDCDGVCNDLLGYALRCVNAPLHRDEVMTHDFARLLAADVRRYDQLLELMDSPGLWAEIPPLEDAQAGVEALRRLGHTLTWVTSPWPSCVGWETVRRRWLHRYFEAGHDEVAIVPGPLKHKVAGHVLIEDRPDILQSWKACWLEGLAILHPQPYNRPGLADTRAWPGEIGHFPRIGWPEIVETIKEYVG